MRDVDVDASGAAEKSGAHLGDKLLARVVGRAERSGLDKRLASEPRAMPGRMDKLVKQRPVVVRRALELDL